MISHLLRAGWRAAALMAFLAIVPGWAAEFSVTPIRAELRAGALNETITITNHSQDRLRVSIKLVEWSQDETGRDIYRASDDLVYFPRQLEIPGGAKRLVRVGTRSPAGLNERTYRLFVEEEPEADAAPGTAKVAFLFRFGVPVFLPPAVPKAEPEVPMPELRGGRLSIVVRNPGNQHFRLTRIAITDGAGHQQEMQGWYSLAGSTRTYKADIPPAVCRAAKSLYVLLEGEGIRLDRKLDVDPAGCA